MLQKVNMYYGYANRIKHEEAEQIEKIEQVAAIYTLSSHMAFSVSFIVSQRESHHRIPVRIFVAK